ncbi:MAG: hypothetical protein GX074_05605 [Erysipelothrix sp.]|nr:hypothetical protein [Erysipelothrix sp.]
MYRISVLTLLIILVAIMFFSEKYGLNETIGLYLIPSLFLIISVYIERKIKNYNIEQPLEIYNFIRGASLEEIRSLRLKPKSRFSYLKIFLLGLVVSLLFQIVIGLIVN